MSILTHLTILNKFTSLQEYSFPEKLLLYVTNGFVYRLVETRNMIKVKMGDDTVSFLVSNNNPFWSSRVSFVQDSTNDTKWVGFNS